MIKEYIDTLFSENQQELSNLERQMRDLLDELTYAQEWEENLQQKNSAHTNIFSPRVFENNIEENLEDVQSKITRLNQEIESTRVLIEMQMKKKSEYQTLLLEIESAETKDRKKDCFDTDQVKKLLNEIFKKTEICLGCLNNRNRCKSELLEIKKMIRNFAEQ